MIEEEKSGFPMAFLVGLAVVLVLFGGIVLLTRNSRSAQPAAEQRLPLAATEQAYAKQIRFLEPRISRVANFLNQEVIILFGSAANDGPRAIREMEVTIEFRDIFNQVVLRDTRRLFGSRATPLASGQRRDFQFNFEHVPADWNHQYPTLRITGLLLD
jgi:hypothetical protein